MAGTQQQIDNLAKARASKKAKAEALNQNKPTEVNQSNLTDGDVWLRGLLIGMKAKDVRAVGYIKTEAVPFADEVLALYKAKFNA